MSHMVERTDEKLSELSFVLAMSRVSMVSLKLQAEMGLDDDDYTLADDLKNHLELCLDEILEPTELPVDSVPDASLRSVVQRMFATVGPRAKKYNLVDTNSLESAIDLLTVLTKTKSLRKDQASLLSDAIRRLRLNGKSVESSHEPDQLINTVGE